jgi:hypothetical protein
MARTNTASFIGIYLLAFALLIQLTSCTKTSTHHTNPGLEGTWQWSQTTAQQKKLWAYQYKTIRFQAKGHYTIAVNGNTHETGSMRFIDAPFGWNFEMEFRRNELLYDQQDYNGIFLVRMKGRDTLELHNHEVVHLYIRKKQLAYL